MKNILENIWVKSLHWFSDDSTFLVIIFVDPLEVQDKRHLNERCHIEDGEGGGHGEFAELHQDEDGPEAEVAGQGPEGDPGVQHRHRHVGALHKQLLDVWRHLNTAQTDISLHNRAANEPSRRFHNHEDDP